MTTQSMYVFKDFIQRNNLVDLPIYGSKFTWVRGGQNTAASRLDRFLFTPEFLVSYPRLGQYALPRGLSDHNPIFLREDRAEGGPRPFKYFSHWSEIPGLVERVNIVASNCKGMGAASLLRAIKAGIKVWVKDFRAKEEESIGEVEEKISQLEKDLLVTGERSIILNEISRLRSSLWTKFRRDEREWLQKSRLKWFKEGDKNTKFFHAIASMRNKANHISCIRVGDAVFSDHRSISKAFVQHFSEGYNQNPIIPVVNFVGTFKSLSETSAMNLERPFTCEEVWEAISTADGSRAPSPDGFNLDFFKKFWPAVKHNVMDFFENFHEGTLVDVSINHSFISLIPKVSTPEKVDDFRPISLVGSLYKILTRVLSRRLAGCLGEVISEHQFSFTAGKQLADCALIENEVIDFLSRNNREAILFKAYDTVDWNFLDLVLQRMGFGTKWRWWVNMCISSASISVLINGVPSSRFNIKRGLRQGCPLSPLLFNLIGEALSVLICSAVNKGILKGVSIGDIGFPVSHIKFADDLMLFLEANEVNVRNTKRVLRVFEVVSGLHLNMKKTKLIGINTDSCFLSGWADSIKCGTDVLPTSYLGLPLGHSHNSTMLWQTIFDKVNSRLDGWKGKLLSFGGRLTLVRSVFSNLPVFFMSLFQMPVSVSNKLNRLIANFLWGPSANRPIHWIKWKDICKPKAYEGLGLFDFKLRNRSLLNKWVWRYGNEPNSYWRIVVDAKLGSSSESLLPLSSFGRNTSWFWKSIIRPLLDAEDCFTKKLRFILGDGKSINFWDDVWIGSNSLKVAYPRIYALSSRKEGKVVEFGSKLNGFWEWNIPLRRRLFDWEIETWERFINALDVASRSLESKDCLRWSGSSSGHYRPKSFCELVSIEGAKYDKMWKWIWSSLVPPKVEFFIWRAVQGRIPTRVELLKRGISAIASPTCALCEEDLETPDHLLCYCKVAWRVWQAWCCAWNVHLVAPRSLRSLLLIWENMSIKPSFRPLWRVAFCGIIWTIWLHRNEIVFKNKKCDGEVLADLALLRIEYWCKSNWPESFVSVNDFILYPAGVCLRQKHERRPLLGSWVAPKVGCFKFNVDGAVKGSFGEAGVGGILRDHNGTVLIRFSESIGFSDPTGAELVAILKACLPPACFTNLVQNCNSFRMLYKWKVCFAFREQNCKAHQLAQEGISRNHSLLHVAEMLQS
ncbi:hypothetical protein GQ457_17G012800 [Hibiscus cannabinus]